MKKEDKSEKIDIKSLFSNTLDDSEQGYYVGNENTNGALATIDSFEYGSRSRERQSTVFLEKVEKEKNLKVNKYL